MNNEKMTAMLQELIEGERIAGAGLKVRKNGELIYDCCLGVGDIET